MATKLLHYYEHPDTKDDVLTEHEIHHFLLRPIEAVCEAEQLRPEGE